MFLFTTLTTATAVLETYLQAIGYKSRNLITCIFRNCINKKSDLWWAGQRRRLKENIQIFHDFLGQRFIFAVWRVGTMTLVASPAWQHQRPVLPIILGCEDQDEYGERRNGTENWLWKQVLFLNWLLPSRHVHGLPKEKRKMFLGYGGILLFTYFF